MGCGHHMTGDSEMESLLSRAKTDAALYERLHGERVVFFLHLPCVGALDSTWQLSAWDMRFSGAASGTDAASSSPRKLSAPRRMAGTSYLL